MILIIILIINMMMFNQEVSETPNLEGLAKFMTHKLSGFKSVEILSDEVEHEANSNLLYYPQDDSTFYQIMCGMLHSDMNKEIKLWRHKCSSGQWQIYMYIPWD